MSNCSYDSRPAEKAQVGPENSFLAKVRRKPVKANSYNEEVRSYCNEYVFGELVTKISYYKEYSGCDCTTTITKAKPAPMPSITKLNLQAFLNRDPGAQAFFPKLSNAGLEAHQKDLETFYYFNNHKSTCDLAVAMIDIDVDKSEGRGSTEGARIFGEYLKTIFPDLYLEPSTNGKGLHGYVRFHKRGLSAKFVKLNFKRLQNYLEHLARKSHANIELVEVKGQPPIVEWEDHRVVSMLYGVLAKLPRKSIANTTTFEMAEFFVDPRWDLPQEDPGSPPEATESPQAERVHRPAADGPRSKCYLGGHGSDSGGISLNLEEVNSHRDHIGAIFSRLTGGHNSLPTNSDAKVTPEDFFNQMVFLLHAYENPNADGSCPMKWNLKFLKKLYKSGFTKRGPNHHRVKAIRDFLQELGFIDWTDNRYEAGEEINGKKEDGIACKWKITQECYQLLLADPTKNMGEEERRAFFMEGHPETIEIPRGTGQHLMPVLSVIKGEKDRLWLAEVEQLIADMSFGYPTSFSTGEFSQSDEAEVDHQSQIGHDHSQVEQGHGAKRSGRSTLQPVFSTR